MRARNILFLFVILMAGGIMACQSGGGSGASSAMDRPIEASSMETYQQYMAQLDEELTNDEIEKVSKAVLTVGMDILFRSMPSQEDLQGMSQEEIKANAEAARANMLKLVHGKTPNEIVKMAEEAEARLKNR